jgi:hypothetical protein
MLRAAARVPDAQPPASQTDQNVASESGTAREGEVCLSALRLCLSALECGPPRRAAAFLQPSALGAAEMTASEFADSIVETQPDRERVRGLDCGDPTRPRASSRPKQAAAFLQPSLLGAAEMTASEFADWIVETQPDREQARGRESGSKLPHSKAALQSCLKCPSDQPRTRLPHSRDQSSFA